MRTADFDYHLPRELIVQAPLPRRDASRLLMLPKAHGGVTHHDFLDLPRLIRDGDLLVVNDTRVIHARLEGRKEHSGGRVEALLVAPTGEGEWRAMVGSSRPVRAGTRLSFSGRNEELLAEVRAEEGGGMVRLFFDRAERDLLALLEGGAGALPLPAYIERPLGSASPVDDRERYQTIFASRPGAVAAPTAGLHFTPELLSSVESRGAGVARVTLHVGPGTFLPVRSDDLDSHVMHAERYEVPAETARAARLTRSRGGRVIAVGTTVLRALEASALEAGEVSAGQGETDLFVRPGYRFRAVDGLVTNFHLPRSTLLMLVCAIAGRERVLGAYAEAVKKGYRFYSYGDAMLLL